VEPSDDEAVRRFLTDRINEFNMGTIGVRDYLPVTFVVRDGDGQVIAGIDGGCWGGTCHITSLWVADGRRGEGLGSRLLEEAEAAARQNGCHQIALETHSFQAPDFYVRRGYEQVGLLDGYPAGGAMHYLRKRLGAG
jgi:ribosomal protein S18 acetylase RimI-like enzyme